MSSLIFSTDKEKQIFMIKKKHMHSVLLYNLQEIQNKRKKRYSQVQQVSNAASFSNQDSLKLLLQQNREKERRRIQQKRLLKQSYQRQIKDKQERLKREKIDEKLHFQQQMQQSEYEQTIRMKQLSKMFNKVSYQGIPIADNKRCKTIPIELEKSNKLSFLPKVSPNIQNDHYSRAQRPIQKLQKSTLDQNKQLIMKRQQQKLKIQSLPPIRINSPSDL